ncbi:hypothetical protein CYMTET_47206 [Cymbomonas tetramitiformis]|uniref:Uncharacterized protein n=1 Tax=Cymbomonas tetramitiformis TaxID=36881 RepID=A0AAE0EWE5_9CHLO|nr:hypothetical protein CYMTET_47206 [Cymbomonas tetramitiformis]
MLQPSVISCARALCLFWAIEFSSAGASHLRRSLNSVDLEAPSEYRSRCQSIEAHPALQCDRTLECIHTSYFYPQHLWDWCATYDDETWPTTEPILRRVPRLHNAGDLESLLSNRTVLLVGDVKMQHLWHAAACGLSRHGLLRKENLFSHDASAKNLSMPLHSRLQMLKQHGLAGCCEAALTENGMLLLHARTAKHEPDLLQRLLQLPDVVLMGHDAQYSTHEHKVFQEDMRDAIRQIHDFSCLKDKAAVVFEAAADHSPPAGRYPAGALDSRGGRSGGVEGSPLSAARCECAAPSGDSQDEPPSPHNQVLHREIQKFWPGGASGTDTLQLLQLQKFTATRSAMHLADLCALDAPQGTTCCDCASSCYTPLYYDHVFDRLHAALRRVLVGKQLAPKRPSAGMRRQKDARLAAKAKANKAKAGTRVRMEHAVDGLPTRAAPSDPVPADDSQTDPQQPALPPTASASVEEASPKPASAPGAESSPTRPPIVVITSRRPDTAEDLQYVHSSVAAFRQQFPDSSLHFSVSGSAAFLERYNSPPWNASISSADEQHFAARYPWLDLMHKDAFVSSKHSDVYFNTMNAYRIACSMGAEGDRGVIIAEDDIALAASARGRLDDTLTEIRAFAQRKPPALQNLITNADMADFILDGYVVGWSQFAPEGNITGAKWPFMGGIYGDTFRWRADSPGYCCTQFIFLSSSQLACRIFEYFKAHPHGRIQVDVMLGFFATDAYVPWLAMRQPIAQHVGRNGTNINTEVLSSAVDIEIN